MVPHESAGELARAWIAQRPYVDSALQGASISVFLAVALVGASTAVYGVWLITRLDALGLTVQELQEASEL